MEAWTRKQTDGTRLLRIDIDGWRSPVASQFGIRSLPTVHLYEGKALVEGDTGAALARLSRTD
ncbi:MAG: hypothetical protein M9894_32770 [Planctomycetes bacterium]|nr:hypothetical protein [Planctomycetota bacterium]